MNEGIIVPSFRLNRVSYHDIIRQLRKNLNKLDKYNLYTVNTCTHTHKHCVLCVSVHSYKYQTCSIRDIGWKMCPQIKCNVWCDSQMGNDKNEMHLSVFYFHQLFKALQYFQVFKQQQKKFWMQNLGLIEIS